MPTIGSFVTGAVVGFGAALVLQQMDHLPDLEDLTRPVEARAATPDAEPRKPRFEFYEMLAKLEVLVPVVEALEGKDPRDDEPIYLLQAASFRRSEDADRLRASLLLLGFDVETHSVTLDGNVWHRVMVGPFASRSDRRHAQSRLRTEDIDALPLARKRKT
ncbi:MAG: SPOR domain-containing protein [Pseudomonadales bacterium]